MKTYAFRLKPGEDLREEIDKFVKERDDIRWFSEEDLENPEFELTDDIKFYAKEALKRAS
jgi:hypothetical protein